MPAPADLVVFNQSSASVTIQSQAIGSGASYTVPFGNLANWATDPFLRAYLLGGVCYIVALGVTLRGFQAADWMDKIHSGSIVYAS